MPAGPATVLFVHSSSGWYGADRQLALIAGGLDRHRFQPLVILPDDGPLSDDLRSADVEVITRPLSVLRRGLLAAGPLAALARATVSDALALHRLIRRREVALVHSNTSVVLGGAAAAQLARVPHVWHVREIYARFGRAWPAYRRLLSTAAALPCVSSATAAQFRPGPRVRVLADGLAVDAHRAPRDQARRVLGLDLSTPVIAVLGRISDWKGQDVLVRALAEPALRSRGVTGLIAGAVWPGAEERQDAIVRLAEELGVTDRLRFIGFRSDVEVVYGAADVIAVPSTLPDPLPNSALEAAAAGCAVVAAAHGGLPDIIHEGATGRLVRPGDHAALARVVAELLDDPGERSRLGAAASADIRSRFAPARLLDGVQGLYDELV